MPERCDCCGRTDGPFQIKQDEFGVVVQRRCPDCADRPVVFLKPRDPCMYCGRSAPDTRTFQERGLVCEPFSYVRAPDGYECTKCGAKGCKMWRRYQTVATAAALLCTDCCEDEQKKKLDPDITHAIGWRVAAVPTEEGDTYWGYTSVPDAGVAWWNALPTRPTR